MKCHGTSNVTTMEWGLNNIKLVYDCYAQAYFT